MLHITIPSMEIYDEKNNLFFNTKSQDLALEHSLVSLSKWEMKYKKPFLVKTDKTRAETLDYIRCMTITQNVDSGLYQYIPNDLIEKVLEYIKDPMTATVITDRSNSINREVITSEVIYYWMINFNIPMECQKWHLNRLITLINVCNIKAKPKEKMSKRALLTRNYSLNEARKAALGTKG